MARTAANSTNLAGKGEMSDRYAKTALPHLLEIQADIEHEMEPLADRLAEVKSAITKRVADAVAQSRKDLGKTEGTVHAAVEGCDVKSTVPKNIKWDSTKLMKACDEISKLGEDPMRYIDFKLSVPEKKYDVLPEKVLDLVVGARTLSHGAEKLEITLAENVQAAE